MLHLKRKVNLIYHLLSTSLFVLVCETFKSASIILIMGLLPLLLADYCYRLKTKWWWLVFLIGMSGYAISFINRYFKFTNLIFVIDGVVLVTVIII